MRGSFSSLFSPVCVLMVLVLASCESVDVEPGPQTMNDPKRQRELDRFGTITGEDGITLLDTNPDPVPGFGDGSGGGIGVNAYLWRGTLDTIEFMPLTSADPFGGLIITEWYQPATAPGERVKLHVLIRDVALRADGVKVSVFRQVNDPENGWLDAPPDPTTGRALEDKILTKARELRIAQIETAQ